MTTGMGTVHKFKRKPKNQHQFKGYRPSWTGAQGQGKPRKGRDLWQKLRPWQQTLAVWALLIGMATAIAAVRGL